MKQDFRMRFVGKLKLLDEKTRAGQHLEEIEVIMSPGDWEALANYNTVVACVCVCVRIVCV